MKYRSHLIPLACFATVVMVGCDSSLSPSDSRHDTSIYRASKDRYEVTAQDIAPYGPLLKAHEQGEQRALRIKLDATRNRLWVLGLKHVYVYDITGKQLVRRVALANWSVAGFVCSPDMALDRSGAAFIASNVESTLWKIDAEDFGIEVQEVTPRGGANRDIGFGALTFAADGALYALTAHEGSLWRIDVARLRANEVALSERLLNTCTLTVPVQRTKSGPPILCAAAGKNVRHIAISLDFTRGHVSNEKCPS